MLTPVQYGERYWQLPVPVPNGPPVTVRIDKYHLGAPKPAKDRLWSALRDHFAAQRRQTPGFQLRLTVNGQPVDFGSTQEMLFHVLRPFFGKGSPEQGQVVLQLVVLLGIKQPAELQGYADENLGLDCNGFVGNYLLHGRGQQPWTVLDGAGSAVGPNSLITQIFAHGNTVTNGNSMFPNRSYILVEVDGSGHVMPGGPGKSPGHIVITEPGKHQAHAFVTDSFGGFDLRLGRQGLSPSGADTPAPCTDRSPESRTVHHRRRPKPAQPPAIAPTTRNGSAPVATASGNGASGGSCETSSAQAKNLTNGRRRRVTWSRIAPRNIG